MAYATTAQFNARYTTRLSDSDLSSHFLPFASSRVDALLAPYFTTPFSKNNLTARDLAIDLAYLLILQRSKEPQEQGALQKRVGETVKALAEGSEAMITSSGEALFGQSAQGAMWSNTSGDAPIFDLGSIFCHSDGSIC